MNSIYIVPSIAAIASIITAILAGFFSYISLVNTKESKTSEFRQNWIDSLRNEVSLLVSNCTTLLTLLDSNLAALNDNEGFNAFLETNKLQYAEFMKCCSSIKLRINPKSFSGFVSDDFTNSGSIVRLSVALKAKNIITTDIIINNISLLNSLLSNDEMYEKCKALNSYQQTEKLIKLENNYKHDNSKTSLIILNRAHLEMLFPTLVPVSSTKKKKQDILEEKLVEYVKHIDDTFNSIGTSKISYDYICMDVFTTLDKLNVETNNILKENWERVKIGEVVYRFAKYISPILLILLIVGVVWLLFKIMPHNDQREMKYTCYFDNNSYRLGNAAASIIREVSRNNTTDSYIILTAHADTKGTDTYNMKLTYMRAISVRNALMMIGIPGEKIYTNYIGKKNLPINTLDNIDEVRNRVVEIIVKQK